MSKWPGSSRTIEIPGRRSTPAIVRELAAKGYTISRRHLIRFQYAVEMLYPLIPTALHSGLGKSQIDFLRQLEQALSDCWTEAGQSSEAFPGIWKDVLMTRFRHP